MIEHVAIVGAGFSGTLQAINLLRHDGPRATLIERSGKIGEGLAYGAAHPAHLLNVRAQNMSAVPDEPDHFVCWLARHGHADAATAFVPRLLYGSYLRELLDAAIAGAGNRLQLLRGEVVDIRHEEQAVLALADGRRVVADAAVLAVGNLPPHDPPGLDPRHVSAERYRGDPWAPGVAEGLAPGDTVLVIGTGLTMVDIALLLEARGFAGRIVALSRRGLLPRRHEAGGGEWRRLAERPRLGLAGLVRQVARAQRSDRLAQRRRRAAAVHSGDVGQCRRRRARAVHPAPAAMVGRASPPARAAGRRSHRGDAGARQLHVAAGKTLAFAETPDGIELTWRRRGRDMAERLRVQRIINCTGPQGDLARSEEPLLRRLTERGAIRPDAAHLGIDIDGTAATIAADGRSNDWLYALGPMTRGAFWEIVAVPDIRWQTWNLARRLSNAHWVGGEGCSEAAGVVFS